MLPGADPGTLLAALEHRSPKRTESVAALMAPQRLLDGSLKNEAAGLRKFFSSSVALCSHLGGVVESGIYTGRELG